MTEQQTASPSAWDQTLSSEAAQKEKDRKRKQKKAGGGPLGWMKRHKVLTVVIVLLCVLMGRQLWNHFAGTNKSSSAYQFVRTTTLAKTTLDNSVSTTGTVAAGSTANVAVADAAKLYKVTEVDVQVGDYVNAGDVICKLDTADVEKSLKQARLDYADTLQSAQTSYDRALDDYNVFVVEHQNDLIDLQEVIDDADEDQSEAESDLKAAQDAVDSAQSACDSASSAYNTIKPVYDGAVAQITSLQGILDAAAKAQSDALGALNADLSNPTLQSDYQTAMDNYNTAKTNLDNAKSNCSVPSLGLYGFDAVESGLKNAETTKASAQSALEQAKTAKKTAENGVDNAENSVEKAHDNYDQTKNYSQLKSKYQTLQDATTRLEQAKRVPDSLTTLQQTLEDCTLTATMSGTVTALNATVGSVCSSTVATIQDVDSLSVEITISADKVPDVKTGMTCYITADTTADTITGTLNQIDPVANEQGTFGAKVKVAKANSGLLVGTQADVEIMESQTNNVFVVPIDAVATSESGQQYVYRKTGGEGVDMTFEEVNVTTGTANDYYVEISGSNLAEGDVIRSSADLTQGIASTENTQDTMSMMMGDTTVVDDGGADMGGDRPNGGRSGGNGGAPGGM